MVLRKSRTRPRQMRDGTAAWLSNRHWFTRLIRLQVDGKERTFRLLRNEKAIAPSHNRAGQALHRDGGIWLEDCCIDLNARGLHAGQNCLGARGLRGWRLCVTEMATESASANFIQPACLWCSEAAGRGG